MKKLINGLAIVLFLAPLFASAAHHDYVCSDFTNTGGGVSCVGNVITFDGSGTGAIYAHPYVFNQNSGSTYYVSASVSGSGTGYYCALGSGTNDNGFAVGNMVDHSYMPVYLGSDYGEGLADAGNGFCPGDIGGPTGQSVSISSLCVADTPGECVITPPAPPQTGIDAAVGVATSSFANTFGFDMDGVASWMWDNLGQPILGSGIGTLYVMRFYWLGFIAIGIIVFFCFAYFRFFKK